MKRLYGLIFSLGLLGIALTGCSNNSVPTSNTPSTPILSPTVLNTPEVTVQPPAPVEPTPGYNYANPELSPSEQHYLDKCGVTGCI